MRRGSGLEDSTFLRKSLRWPDVEMPNDRQMAFQSLFSLSGHLVCRCAQCGHSKFWATCHWQCQTVVPLSRLPLREIVTSMVRAPYVRKEYSHR